MLKGRGCSSPLRGVNHGLWSHLGVQDKTPLFLAVKVSFRVALEEIKRNAVCVCFKVVSFTKGSNKARATPRLVSIFRRASPIFSNGSLPLGIWYSRSLRLTAVKLASV